MFKKKPKDKHREDNGANTRNNSSTVRTVTRTENGNSVTTRTTSVSSTKIITREERSFQIHQSSSGGSVSSFSSDRNFSTNFSPRTIFDNNSFKTEPFQSDAVPFSSYGSQRRTSVPYRSPYSSITYSSYPTRSNSSTVVTRPPISSTFTPTNFTRPTTTVTTSSLAVPAVTRSTSVVPTYEHTSRKLGKALIINNINFSETKEERKGAKKDSEDLTNLLKELGFEVKHNMDVKGKNMLQKAKDFSRSNFSEHNISLVVMMSHGSNVAQNGEKLQVVRGGFTQIYGVDNDGVLVDDVIDLFVKDQYHPSLRGKPKIFIFQCCRGAEDQPAYDAKMIQKPQPKEHADILVAFSTLPGYVSNRDPSRGSWYIQSLCETVKRHYKDYHIEDILKIVDDELSNKHPRYTQTSTYESRGFKRCFLYKS